MSDLILSISVSSRCGSAALFNNGQLITEVQSYFAKEHSSKLLSMIDFVFNNSKTELKNLQRIITDVGPGSFTGIRIGLSTVLGLAKPYGIKLSGVSSMNLIGNTYPDKIKRLVTVPASAKEYYIFEQDEVIIVNEKEMLEKSKKYDLVIGPIEKGIITEQKNFIKIYPDAKNCLKNKIFLKPEPLYIKKSYVE